MIFRIGYVTHYLCLNYTTSACGGLLLRPLSPATLERSPAAWKLSGGINGGGTSPALLSFLGTDFFDTLQRKFHRFIDTCMLQKLEMPEDLLHADSFLIETERHTQKADWLFIRCLLKLNTLYLLNLIDVRSITRRTSADNLIHNFIHIFRVFLKVFDKISSYT